MTIIAHGIRTLGVLGSGQMGASKRSAVKD